MDRTDLQHDAFKLNGSYLEDQISGYMTYKAVGRESLDKQISTYTNGTDGETLKRTNYPKRIIEISYVVKGSSLADLRTKMHSLQTKLNVENAEIVFNDDPNNYYIATPVMSTSINDAWNSADGTYQLVCHDPFKYAKTLTTVQTSSKTDTVTDEDGNTSTVTSQVLTTDNTGGYKTFPTFQVQFATDLDSDSDMGTNADCGYVLFAKGGTDYSIQIGDEQEKDTETVKVLSHTFAASKRGGFTDTNTLTPLRANEVYNGSSKATAKGLMINSTSNVSKKFHGPLALYTASSSSYYATSEFTLNWKHVVACAKDTATGKKQAGCFWILLYDASNNVKMAYGLIKGGTTNLKGTEYVYDYINGLWTGTSVDLSYTGKNGYKKSTDTTGRLATCSFVRKITRDDNNNITDCRTIIKNAAGKEKTIVESSPCTIAKIGFYIGKYSTAAAFHSNRATMAQFIVGDVDNVNVFGSGDYAEVDCGKAEITLNNMPADDLGDVGNNWEDMYLDTGTNTIYVQHSDWVTSGYEPTVTMTYRKRWL